MYAVLAPNMELVHMVPLSISFQGKPLDILHRRPMFQEMFKKERPVLKDVYICGRQLGKTVSISSSILMHCWWRDYFRMLYISPMSIYTQRLHSMFMQPMIQGKLLPWQVMDRDCVSNVGEKSFIGGSRYVGIACFNNAGNSLGLSSDWAIFDECTLGNTLLSKSEKSSDILVDFVPGDAIFSFDESTKRIERDTVKSVVHKGKRHAWRLTLGNGLHIECTGNERIMSDGGWIYLADILPWEEANRCPRTSKIKALRSQAGANGLWNSSWRLVPVKNRWWKNKRISQVLRDAWRLPGKILQPKGGRAWGSSEDKTAHSGEQGLGSGELCVWIPVGILPRAYSPSVLHGHIRQRLAEKESHERVVEQADLGGGSVVVDGRREHKQGREARGIQYPGIPGTRSRHAGIVPEQDGGAVQVEANTESTEGRVLLGNFGPTQGVEDPHRKHAPVLVSRDGIQMGLHRNRNPLHLPSLWRNLRSAWAASPLGLLLQRGMLGATDQGDKEEVGTEITGLQKRKIEGEILGESGGIQGAQQADHETPDGGPGAPCSYVGKEACQERGSILPGDLPLLREPVPGGRQHLQENPVLRIQGLPIGGGQAEGQAGSVQRHEEEVRAGGAGLRILRGHVPDEPQDIKGISEVQKERVLQEVLEPILQENDGKAGTGSAQNDSMPPLQERVRLHPAVQKVSSFLRGCGLLEGEKKDDAPRHEDYSQIVGIAYIGVQDVYDLETEKNHTFFANGIGVHNCQDLNADFIPQIREVVGTSDYRYESYFGTARGVDNTLTTIYEGSTQNIWKMECPKCKHENYPTMHGNVLDMIQKEGICCVKCKGLLDVDRGSWQRTFEYDPISRDMEGYHVPQIIVKDRLTPHSRYIDTIYNKLHGSMAYSEAKFLQEVLGIPTSQGGVPLTQQDIKAVSTLEIPQDGSGWDMDQYHNVTGGVDWGGAEIVSFTVGALVGYRDGKFDCFAALRPTGLPDESRHYVVGDFLKKASRYKVRLVGADAGFVGSVQNPNLEAYMGVQVGSIAYGTTRKFFVPQTNNCFTVDRTTLIYIVISLIKMKKIRFPKDPWFDQYTRDLLAIYTEDSVNSHGITVRRYCRYKDRPDDFLHALGYAVFMCALGMVDLPAMAGMPSDSSLNAPYIRDIGEEMGRFGG